MDAIEITKSDWFEIEVRYADGSLDFHPVRDFAKAVTEYEAAVVNPEASRGFLRRLRRRGEPGSRMIRRFRRLKSGKVKEEMRRVENG